MEQIDGIQVLQRIREKKYPTAVIILTGHGNISSAISALRYRADDYMLKPSDIDELLFRVEKCLSKFADQNKLAKEQEKTAELTEYSQQLSTIRRSLENELTKHKKTQEELIEANHAMRHLLKLRDGEKLQLEEKALVSMKDSVLYHLHEIDKEELTETQKRNLQIVESNLHRFIRTFSAGITAQFLKLTPMELQIIALIKRGRVTKDIASTLNISNRTVENHRLNIRKKLGIKHSGVNLKSSLTSIY